jgi:hypothetical protein
MATVIRGDTPDLELALLRRGLHEMEAGSERCSSCRRTPLIGERVYQYDADELVCELCRDSKREQPSGSRLVHGPAFGHTIRVIDQRVA